MSDKKTTFRLNDDDMEILETFKQKFNVNTNNQALKSLLKKYETLVTRTQNQYNEIEELRRNLRDAETVVEHLKRGGDMLMNYEKKLL